MLCVFFLQYSFGAFGDQKQYLRKTKKSQSSFHSDPSGKPTNSPVTSGRSEGCAFIYKVRKRETVSSLLKRFGMKSKDFDRLNAVVAHSRLLSVNQSLCIVPGATSMVVSYYGEKFRGKKTSNGEIFNPDGLTAAHKSFPPNTILRVTNRETNKSVDVRINDCGPFVKNRDVDVSEKAAKILGLKGVATLFVQIVFMPQAGSKA